MTDGVGVNHDARQNSPPSRSFAAAFRRLTGNVPDTVRFPGGTNRKSAVVACGETEWVVSRRASADRAALEAGVLAELARFGAPVPRLVVHEGFWIVQERLMGERLTLTLDRATGALRLDWLRRAAASLAQIHEAGRRAGLARRVAPIGARDGWLEHLIDMPRRLGRAIGVTAPDLPTDRMARNLTTVTPQFIKWDTRPGNAMAAPSERVFWFDWEHCGCRDPLDDLAWLLGDEWTPDDEAAESGLLSRHLSDFRGSRSHDEARAYLMAFGTFHTAVRLSLIVEHRGNGPWWDRHRCLAQDKIGVTPEGVARLCRRGARWAAASGETAALAPWFRAAAERLLSAPPDEARRRPPPGR